jgi:hypothetical protein
MILFAFTGLALGLGASFTSGWALAGAITGVVADAALVAASAYSAYSSAQMSRANAKAAAQQQQIAAQQQRLQAEAQQAAAADLERQAANEQAKAGIAQMQAEQEAERRSRIMANDIGSAYANYAGNGLLVEGGDDDTFGRVLTTTVKEAEQDISTIKDNGRMSVWDYKSNAESLMVSARTQRLSSRSSLLGEQSSLIGAAASRKNAKYYNQASYIGAATGGISSAASAVSSGFAGASYAKKTA